MKRKEWTIGLIVVVVAAAVGLLVHASQPPAAPVSPPAFEAQQAGEVQSLDWTDLGILEVYFDDEDCVLPDDFAAYSDHAIIVVCTEDETLKQKLLDIEQWLRDHPHHWRFYLPVGGQLLWFPVLRKRG